MNETDPSERSATNVSVPAKNYPPLAPAPQNPSNSVVRQDQATAEKLAALVSKLEGIAQSGSA